MYNLVFVFCSSIFLLVALVALLRQGSILKKTEKKGFSNIQSLFLSDWVIRFSMGYFSLLFFYSVVIVFVPMWKWNGFIWLAAAILGLLLLLSLIRRCIAYTEREFLLKKLSKRCIKAFQKGNDEAILYHVDIFIELFAHAVKKRRLVHAKRMLKLFLHLIEEYVRICGSRPRLEGEMAVTDKITLFVAYIGKSLHWVYKEALYEHIEPVNQEIISFFGKSCVRLSHFHEALGVLPLNLLDRCSKEAIAGEVEDVIEITSPVLSEIAKSIIELSLEKGSSYKEVLRLALSLLEENVRATYEMNRDINPALLMQPFAEIGQFLGQERYKSMPHYDSILEQLKRYMSQFNMLDLLEKE